MLWILLISFLSFSQTPAASPAEGSQPIIQSPAAPTEAQVQIEVTEAKTRKSLIALTAPQVAGSFGGGEKVQKAATEIHQVLTKNLEMTGYFDLISQVAFLEDVSKIALRPFPDDPSGFTFDSWKQIGAEILVRSQYFYSDSQINLEVQVYQVGSGKQVLAKKYKGSVETAKRIAHTFANDILESLTGKRGMFLSRITASSDRGGDRFKEIYLMEWDGENVRKLSDHKSVALSPAISADGLKVAYSAIVQRAKTKTRNIDLYLYDIPSGSRSQLSFREGINSGANFDPSGSALFATLSQGGTSDIYKLSLEGTVISQVTKGPRGAMNVEPAISPDGKTLAFSSDRGGNPMIYTMDVDGTNLKRITLAGTNNASPAWSPDGQKIAFTGWKDDHFDIFTVSPDGSDLRLIVQSKKPNGRAANNENPVFSPDGRFLLYSSNRTGANQLYISNLDGTKEIRVTNDEANYFSPKWSKNIE